MKFDWMEQFADPYYSTPGGKGVFFSGIVLGMIARGQIKSGSGIAEAPMYKQIVFGRMKRRDLQRHLSRIPDLIKAYQINYDYYLNQLWFEASENLIQDDQEMGVDGNFAFSLAFVNASEYFWMIFKKEKPLEGNQTDQVLDTIEGGNE